MDPILKKQLDNLQADLKERSLSTADPVSRLLAVTLLHCAVEIADAIEAVPDKVVDRLCSRFIPRDKTDAMPALAIVTPSLKSGKKIGAQKVVSDMQLSYRIDTKTSLTWLPLFQHTIIASGDIHILTAKTLYSKGAKIRVDSGMLPSQAWVGIEIDGDLDSLEGVTMLANLAPGIMPERICAGDELQSIDFAGADRIDKMPMAEPWDGQQSNHDFFEMLASWRESLTELGNPVYISITDKTVDRDLFKLRPYPRHFQQILESNDLDRFSPSTLWLFFDYGDGVSFGEDVSIMPNVMPVVNVTPSKVTLTSTQPMARLDKDSGSYFLRVIETSASSVSQGFSQIADEVTIRDFDALSYDAGALYRDVRNLYNRFIDDYNAFISYHGLKDGELVKTLRETVNKIARAASDASAAGADKFGEGVYVMSNVARAASQSPVKVSYLTTAGAMGNTPRAGSKMENRKDAALERDVPVIIGAMGGADKASADSRYELLRYYTLTADRLYTRMDVDAFLRLRLREIFGKTESRRIMFSISVQGAAGERGLRRGLYIDIIFKDAKNFERAKSISLDRLLERQILSKSCISLPVIIAISQVD